MSWADVARELDLSPSQLRDLTKTAEFDAAYNQLFAELGHDPRFRAAQGAVADMLPLATVELKRLLTGTRTPAGVRLRAIERIFSLNGLNEPQQQGNDRQELARFLVEHHITLESVGIVVPPEYDRALRDALP